MQNFQAHEIGNELISLYEKAGLYPFEIRYQSEMTPTQKWVIFKTLEWRAERKKEAHDKATNGEPPSSPPSSPNGTPNGLTPNGAYSKRQELVESNVAGGQSGTVTYVNQDFDENSDLIMDDDEVMTDPNEYT